jgi:hypothetical protein
VSEPATAERIPCPVHPTEIATGVCARCGRFLCEGCTVEREDGVFCRECERRTAGLFSGSWLSISAGIAAFVGLGCAPFAVAAAGLATTDLALIASGRGRKGGRLLDLVSLGLAACGILIGVLLVLRLLSGEPFSEE